MMHGTDALFIGVALGLMIAAIIAGWVWVSCTPGFDHRPTREEIREAVWRDWHEGL